MYVQDVDSIPGVALSWRVMLCVYKVVSQGGVVLPLLFSLTSAFLPYKCPAQPWVGAVRLDVAQDDALSVKENTVSPTNELED